MLGRLLVATLNYTLGLTTIIVILSATFMQAIGWRVQMLASSVMVIGFVAGLVISSILFGTISILLMIEQNTRQTSQNTRRIVEALDNSAPLPGR